MCVRKMLKVVLLRFLKPSFEFIQTRVLFWDEVNYEDYYK
jgi:hypothetical protein